MDRRKSAGKFDHTKPLVSAKQQTCFGEQLTPGDPIPAKMGLGARRRLWMTGKAQYGEEQEAAPKKEAKKTDPAKAAPVKTDNKKDDKP